MPTPCAIAPRRSSSTEASSTVGSGASRYCGRHHPLRQVVDPLELLGATGHRQPTRGEEVLHDLLRLRPVPAPVLLETRSAVVELARGGRAPLADLGEDRFHELRLVGDRVPPEPALLHVAHPVAHVRPQLDRHERRDVCPVLHDPARVALGRTRQQVRVVGPHAGEQRHVVRPLQHVDRVDLQHRGARERAVEGAHRRHRVPRVAEPLRHQRDPSRLRLRQRDVGAWRHTRNPASGHRRVGSQPCREAARDPAPRRAGPVRGPAEPGVRGEAVARAWRASEASGCPRRGPSAQPGVLDAAAIRECRGASRGPRTSRPPCASAAAASRGCCARGSSRCSRR